MKLDPNFKNLFPSKYADLLKLIEEERLSQALQLCQERLVFSDDPYIRLIICLIYKTMGFTSLVDMELFQLSTKIKDISDICEILKTKMISEEFFKAEPSDYHLPLCEPIPLKEELILETPAVDFTPSEETLEKEAEILKDLATPNLAELYVEQGAIQEAISIYETYLRTNPTDEEALKRLKELKGPDPTETLIKILEDWLMNLRATLSTN